MTILSGYRQFSGRHWETGTIANHFAYRGVRAPHTGQPYSEALLMGVSGGVVMGYFSFDYEGYDPMARILTRNTFDPWDTMLSRLGVAQNIQHTARPDRAVRNLLDALEEATPPIIWADMWSLPYNGLEWDQGMWAMFPIVVYGYEEAADRVSIADRARVGVTTTVAELAAARARVKNNKHRLITLEAPDNGKLAAAVTAGIWDCIRLYTEAPPRGSKNNFGLAAFRWWAELLANPRARLSWEREFPAGSRMVAGLSSAFTDIALFGKRETDHADRGLYADFLEEAAAILGRSALRDVASRFRESAVAWGTLAHTLLPDDVPPLRETRELMAQRQVTFIEQGNAARETMAAIDRRLREIKTALSSDFPLTHAQIEEHRARIAAQVMAIHDIESSAVSELTVAMS